MYIKGTGMTRFGISTKPEHMMAYEAAYTALQESGLKIKDIDAVAVSNIDFYFHGTIQRHMASMLSSVLKTNVPIIRLPAACGGSGNALHTALRWGYKNILVIGTEKLMTNHLNSVTEEFMWAAEKVWEQKEGLNFPASNALVAQAYMSRYDCTTDDLARIAFKNHNNAAKNPDAYFYGKPVSLDTIKNSPVVASPLRKYDCSVSVDGATACVISTDKTDIEIVGSGLFVDYLPPFEREDLTTWTATVNAARQAYDMAGIGPEDIDLAEVHDAFTIVELLAYEDLGFAKKGEGAMLIRDGTVEIGGRLPINMSGGLKAKGHPVSATGLAQIHELVNQLRGRCKERQVKNPRYALAQNIGGAGSTVIVHILKKQ